MNKLVFEYSVLPSVVRADVPSTVIIRPLGQNVAFRPDLTYRVRIMGMETFCSDFKQFPAIYYDLTPNENGDLVLEHTFVGEQAHAILISRPDEDRFSPYRDINNNRKKAPDNVESKLYVYSLLPDLYGMKGFKGEVHCHTYESDGTQDMCHTVGNYRGGGYDFLAITDHYHSFASQNAMKVFGDAPVDMTLIFGEEVHTKNERIHAVHLGGRESINDYRRNCPEQVEAEVQAIRATLPKMEKVDDYDYAWRVWIAQKAREFGGLSILAHPHWVWFDVYFMATEITKQLLRDEVYDALDLRDTEVDTSVALWADIRAEGHVIPVVGSTDSHYTSAFDGQFPAHGGYTIVFAPDNSTASLMEGIRLNRSLCVDTRSTQLIFGPSRLVKFARFLIENYFPVYIRMCRTQGELMSQYPPQGKPDAEIVALLEGLNKRSREFTRNFYGY